MSIEHPKKHLYPDSVILRKFEGKVSADEIMQSWQDLEADNRFTNDIQGVLNDLEDCELTMDIKGFKRLMSLMLKKDYIHNIRIAVVTNSTRNIIFPTLGETQFRDLKIKPFSTIQAAVDWILE